MKGGSLSHRLLVGFLAVAMLAALGFVAIMATGVGPDRRIRLALGLTVPISPCSRTAEAVRNPPGSTGSWRSAAPLPQPRDEIRAVGTGTSVYVGTGVDLVRLPNGPRSIGTLYRFDVRKQRYSAIPEAPARVDHALLLAGRGSVYLVGGFTDGKATSRAWRYAPALGRWSELPPMPTPRGALAGAIIGDQLYAVGGAPPTFSGRPTRPFATLEILDLTTEVWRTGPPMRFARHHLAAATVDGKLYVVGGRGFSDLALDRTERFDPFSRAWRTVAPLPQGSGALAAVAVGEEIVAIGGGDDREGWVTGATWGLDTKRNRWRRLPNLSVARHGHGAAVVGNRVFVFGGSPCPGPGQTDSVETVQLR